MSDDDGVLVSVPISPELHRRLLERARVEKVSLSDLLVEAVESFEAYAADRDARVGRLLGRMGMEPRR